jgi:hypothetical protein
MLYPNMQWGAKVPDYRIRGRESGISWTNVVWYIWYNLLISSCFNILSCSKSIHIIYVYK